MNRYSRHGLPNNSLLTVCVGGVFILDKRIGNERRQKSHKFRKDYDLRANHSTKNFNRRRQSIDVVV